jgi:hypothetical protein
VMGSGAYPVQAGSGAYPVAGSGAYPVAGSGAYPVAGSGAYPVQAGSGAYPVAGSGAYPVQAGSGAYPAAGSGPYQRPTQTGSMPRADRAVPPSDYPDSFEGRSGQGWSSDGYRGGRYAEEPRWDDGFPKTDPNLRYREPGPGTPGYRGSRGQR